MNRFFHRFTEAGVAQRTFAVLFAAAFAALITGTAFGQSGLRCESTNGRRQECRFEGSGTVHLSRQLSRNACVEGQSWGVKGNTIWVNNGCRADFALVTGGNRDRGGWNTDTRRGDAGNMRPRQNRTITVVCESRDGRRHRCAADTLGQITLGRQLTRENKCVEGRTWGYDSQGIWVDRGCSAEFSIADNGGTYRDVDVGVVGGSERQVEILGGRAGDQRERAGVPRRTTRAPASR